MALTTAAATTITVAPTTEVVQGLLPAVGRRAAFFISFTSLTTFDARYRHRDAGNLSGAEGLSVGSCRFSDRPGPLLATRPFLWISAVSCGHPRAEHQPPHNTRREASAVP